MDPISKKQNINMCCQYIFMLKYKGKDFKEGEKYGLYN